MILDKPAGWTSHDVVGRVRRLLRTKRVGHTGTLDPFATGVLVCLVGRATRLAQFLAGAEKEYEATIRFGYRTDTGDRTGRRVVEGSAPDDAEIPAHVEPCDFDEAALEAALASLRGAQEQIPPMYSAKKIAGRKLYELARRGEEVERKATTIFVREFAALHGEDEALMMKNSDGTCDLRARVVCSAGTYVRVLAEDLGARLGKGAHLAGLRRTRAGAFTLADALTPDELSAFAESGAAHKHIISPAAALRDMPSVHLTDDELADVRHGRPVPARRNEEFVDGARVRLLTGDGTLVAVGAYVAPDDRVQPRVLLVESANAGATNR